jgi:hypothetical protein
VSVNHVSVVARLYVPALAALGGCSFNWSADVETGCPEFRTWYVDADDDGWGDASASQESCFADDPFTARNDRDCNDADPLVTGRAGSICPSALVLDADGGASRPLDDVVGGRVGEVEVAAVYGATPLVWARAAEDACGPNGWGGLAAGAGGTGLVSLPTGEAVVALLDRIGSVDDAPAVWAGYVGVVFDAAQGRWEWRTGEAVDETRLCRFDGDGVANATDYDPEYGFLALVRDRPPLDGGGQNGDWCLGTPSDALGAQSCGGAIPCYEARYGHFVCGRVPPLPANYEL